MKLWTIQHEEAYREFERTGVLRANNDYLFCEDDFRYAYDWIAQQMAERIGTPPDAETKYPIWAWYKWEGKWSILKRNRAFSKFACSCKL